MPERFVAIHGHFYQPPRENPWLEAVEVQDSAAPYHDWNERITAECYAPNTAARRVGHDNRIIDIGDNFEKISFNVGPTLMAWLERHAHDVYTRIVDADRASAAARGHGNAMAQAYNHVIMPLATRRDKVTQVLWGIADFRARFGRDPEGMWLPETAVDGETLEVLAEAGLRFTILAPHQARRVRPLGADAWAEVNDRVDPSRPYLWRGPRDLRLALFFYDGPISRAIAFGDALDRAENLVARLGAGFAGDREGPQLVHCATDGESYGHHKTFGEMALAAALHQIEAQGVAALTNYAAFLAAHPPTHEAEIHERTSWSCAHGVERWRADCGCRTRGDWHQRWRGPLREALDWLRDQVDGFYEARASAFLKDPWAARDAYVAVVLDRDPDRLHAWLEQHQRAGLDDAAHVDVRRLLELQRNRLLMYTSCGWFFDELSALEPVQVLRYAALALQHLRDLGGGNLEPEFVRRLEAAPSNVADFGNGAEVYRRLVRSAAADLRRVVAHYAITGLAEAQPDDATVYAWRVTRQDEAREAYDGSALRIGHVRVTSRVTGDVREAMYALLHFGGHDFSCGIRGWEDAPTYEAMKADLLARYEQRSLTDIVRGLDEYFPRELMSLTHLFIEERRRVLASVIAAVLARHEETYHRLWEESRKLVRYLRQAEAPVPDVLRITAKHVLEAEMSGALARTPETLALPERVFELAGEARALGVGLELLPMRPLMSRAVGAALEAVRGHPAPDRIETALALITGAQRVGLRFGLWQTQNHFFALWRERPEARPALVPLAEALGFDLPLGPAS
jgi:alpha-amylase/alpha-mannosidase (GH57 family)